MQFKSHKFQILNSKFQGIHLLSWDLGLGTWFLCLLLAFSLQGRGSSLTPTVLLDSASATYSKGNFQKASEYYEGIISLGYESPEVYFNLGNTYYKMDNIAKSILNYERAKKLTPQDEDIIFNLKLANQRTLDKIEPAPKLFLEEWWDNLKSAHSEKRWSMRSIICFALFLFFLGVFITSRKAINKQFGFWLGIVFFSLSAISFSISKSRYNDMSSHDSAVILSSSAEIKNAPAESGTKLFILHEGTVVSTHETKGDWLKVELTKEKVGWIKKSSIEFI